MATDGDETFEVSHNSLLNDALCEGWLFKSPVERPSASGSTPGQRRGRGRWLRRWFTLVGRTLEYRCVAWHFVWEEEQLSWVGCDGTYRFDAFWVAVTDIGADAARSMQNWSSGASGAQWGSSALPGSRSAKWLNVSTLHAPHAHAHATAEPARTQTWPRAP